MYQRSIVMWGRDAIFLLAHWGCSTALSRKLLFLRMVEWIEGCRWRDNVAHSNMFFIMHIAAEHVYSFNVHYIRGWKLQHILLSFFLVLSIRLLCIFCVLLGYSVYLLRSAILWKMLIPSTYLFLWWCGRGRWAEGLGYLFNQDDLLHS